MSAGRKGSPAAGRTTARSKASVARALMATGQAIDVSDDPKMVEEVVAQ